MSETNFSCVFIAPISTDSGKSQLGMPIELNYFQLGEFFFAAPVFLTDSRAEGCQMVYFQTKIPNFGGP
jgi:hypothetical protein